jgi:glutamyl-tRNA synthetase
MHMPLLLGKDGKKLSKRRNPTSIFYYRDSGYLPEAFVNFMTLMGYSMPNDKEMYSLEEIIKEFDPSRIGVSGAYFDVSKLDWLNQQYLIQNIPENQLWERIRQWSFNDAFMAKLMPLCHTRIKTFSDFMELCCFFFISKIPYSDDLLCPSSISKEKVPLLLQGIIWSMDEQENWGRSGIEKAAHDVAELFGVNFKKIIIPVLFGTFTGKRQGPPLFDSVDILGKDRARARLLNAIDFLGGISNKKMDALNKAWIKKDCKDLML